MSNLSQKPPSTSEIEAMLRSHQDKGSLEQGHSVRSDIVSAEPLGPGDVQHLQNTALSQELGRSKSNADDEFNRHLWPGHTTSTEELLRQAEQHLEDALSLHSEALVPSLDPVPLNFPVMNSEESSQRETESPVTTSSKSFQDGIPLQVVGDIELDVSLELGRAEMTIEELLQLREGSVVALHTDADDPIDILANGRLIARGEVVVINEKYGIRICEVIGS